MKILNKTARAASLPLAAVSLIMGVSACQKPGSASPELSVEHRPTVHQEVMTLDVRLAVDGSIPEREIARLDGWLDAVNVRYGDRVSLDSSDAPAGTRRNRQLSELLSERSLLRAVESPVTGPAIAPGTARVVLVRAMASVPECPDHSRRSNPEYQGSKTSNFGCATVSNLAAMIADPNDLVSGKPHAGVTADTAVKAIAAQRESQTRATVSSSVGTATGSN